MKNLLFAHKQLLNGLKEELEFHYRNLELAEDISAKMKIMTKIDQLEFQIESLLKDIIRWEEKML